MSAGWRSWIRAAAVLTAATISIAPSSSAPRPASAPSVEADELARRMLAAVDSRAWDETRVLSWNFRGDRQHLWDRDGSRARVRWKRWEVQLELATRRGVALRDGEVVRGARAEKALEEAFGFWVNDSFWLNPVVKVFDDGTSRSLVSIDDPPFADGEKTALLVEYSSGGLTPGDAYLWHLDADARPVGWQMWTSNIPVGGARATWQEWTLLETGAWVALRHQLRLGAVDLSDVRGARSLGEWLEGAGEVSPFAALEGLPATEG